MRTLLLFWWVTIVGVADDLSVELGTVLSDVRRRPTGVNVDYLMDDDRNSLLAPRRSLSEALRELGPGYVRYPGGWKSALNLWSVPPYASSQPTPARPMPAGWIPAGVSLTSPDGSWRIDPLNFDEFMEVCRAIGAEPCVVVAYESCHWPPTRDGTPPSREQLLETAVAWVRYANKVKGYAVKYWEIGNESWLNNETWTNRIPAATYAADLVEFSQFWNTHNIYSELDGGVFDALMRDNTLSPVGRALWIWNHFLGDEMTATTGSEHIRCFAGRKADRQITVFLLNKDTVVREAAVTLHDLPKEFTQAQQWVFRGNGPSDQHPVWTGAGSLRVTNSRILTRLDPVSVTVIVLEPGKRAADTTGPITGMSTALSPRQIVSLDVDWRFHRGDILTTLTENAAGGDVIPIDSPLSPAYDDSAWRMVDVPHDYIVEGTFDPQADTLHGSLPAEPGWYRKTIAIPTSAQGRRLWLEFDGVYRDSRMWLNGRFLGRHASGYTSFRYDVTDVARCGGDNLLTVRVDPTGFEGWWYEGGGIYRHTRLVSVAPVHVMPWGVRVIAAVPDPGDGMQANAGVEITTAMANEAGATAGVVLLSEIIDAGGAVVAKAQDSQAIAAKGRTELKQTVELPQARLWSCEQPYLYRLRSTVMVGGQAVDQVTTTFGVRVFRFDAARGFLLNGRPVKIKGVCCHQDFAACGVALPDRIHEFRVRRLKEMGANAYRFSHHPMAPELLDVCDRLGMLVMDENRNLGDSPEVLKQVESMVLRDRNHPCVILWSLCNEEKEQGSDLGAKQARAMIELIRRLDPTRPVTAAMNGGFGIGLTDVIEVQGFNYHPQDYDRMHEKLPQKPVIATETAAEVSTRGVYVRERFSRGNESFEGDPQRCHLAAYGLNAPGWAQTAEVAWKAVAERPWMAGGFVWTGFDYRGEPTPFGWPCIGSQFGIMDICGFPKDAFYYYQSWWSDRPVLHILPHWNWPDREGEEIDVWVYGNCQKVELLLNSASLGEQEMKPNGHLEWKVKYAPGKLAARGVYDSKMVTAQVETTGAPLALALEPCRGTIAADGADVSLVTAKVVDGQSRTVPVASNEIAFTVTGAGRLLGVGNGDPSCHESDKGARRSAFNGLCLAVVQASDAAGTITIKADSAGLESATVSIAAR